MHDEPRRPPSSVTTPLSSLLPALPVLAIDNAPDFDAFGLGLELMIFTGLLTISAVLVLNWILKMMRSAK